MQMNSGFPTEPVKAKVIAPKGTVTNKLTYGAGRENITLAVSSAADRVLNPLIIFSGGNFQSNWRGKQLLKNLCYGISKTGWMTTEIFHSWFEKFCQQIEERPLVLVYDGHLSHVLVNVIEKTIPENVTIIKLPPHSSDKLLPINVRGFGPLKRLWSRELNDRVNEIAPPPPKKKNTNQICICCCLV